MQDLVDFIKSFDMHTIIIVGIAFWWLNGSINEVKHDLNEVKSDVRVIKTVLAMKGIMTHEVACTEKKEVTTVQESL